MVEDFVRRTFEEKRDAKTYKYASITVTDGDTTAAVWTPASGKSIRLSSAIISVTAASVVELRWESTTFCHLEFNDRKAVPLYLPFDLKGGKDKRLIVYFKPDSGSATCYITVQGEEE